MSSNADAALDDPAPAVVNAAVHRWQLHHCRLFPVLLNVVFCWDLTWDMDWIFVSWV